VTDASDIPLSDSGALRSWRLRVRALCCGVLLATLLMALPTARVWYWVDEALTIGIVRQPLSEIPTLLAGDGSPPGYYLLLGIWTSLLDATEASTHTLSLLFSLLTIPVACVANRRFFGDFAASIAGALFAFSPFLSFFASETRMYTLVVLLSLVVAAAFVDGFVLGRRPSAIAFPVALTALVYTHNWGLYTAAAAAGALVPIAIASNDRRRILRQGVASLAAVGLAYLPWALVLLGQLGETGAPWAYTPRPRELVWEIAALVRDERVLLLLAVVAGGALLPILQRPKTREGVIAWVLLTFTVVPIGLGWAVAHLEPSWATRYLAVVVGPMLLLVAWGLSRAGAIGFLALVVSVGLWVQPIARITGGLDADPYAKSDGKLVAQQLDELLAPGDLVVVAQPEAVPLFDLYMDDDVRFATLYGGVLEDPMVMDWRGAPAKLGAADVEVDLLPVVDELGPGQRVALVGPDSRLVRTDTDWIRTFHRKHRSWLRALRADPDLDLVRVIDPDLDGVKVPFEARVFQVIGTQPEEQ